MRRFLILLFGYLQAVIGIYAQQIVSGQVIDQSGLPISPVA